MHLIMRTVSFLALVLHSATSQYLEAAPPGPPPTPGSYEAGGPLLGTGQYKVLSNKLWKFDDPTAPKFSAFNQYDAPPHDHQYYKRVGDLTGRRAIVYKRILRPVLIDGYTGNIAQVQPGGEVVEQWAEGGYDGRAIQGTDYASTPLTNTHTPFRLRLYSPVNSHQGIPATSSDLFYSHHQLPPYSIPSNVHLPPVEGPIVKAWENIPVQGLQSAPYRKMQ